MVISATQMSVKRNKEINYQRNFFTNFVLLITKVMVFWLLYWPLFAGCTVGFQEDAELDSQRVQQPTCLDYREWIL
jgi:hypothetical protein